MKLSDIFLKYYDFWLNNFRRLLDSHIIIFILLLMRMEVAENQITARNPKKFSQTELRIVGCRCDRKNASHQHYAFFSP